MLSLHEKSTSYLRVITLYLQTQAGRGIALAVYQNITIHRKKSKYR